MPTGSYSELLSVDGKSMTRSVSKTADAAACYGDASAPITLPAAKAGSLTTRTDDDTGVITSAGHGIEETDIVNVFWVGGMRYGMTVSSHDANTLNITGGTGDNLPAQDTAVKVAPQILVNCAIDGDEAELIGVLATKRAHIVFHDGTSDVIRAVELQAAEPDIWDSSAAGANPYTGDPITHAHASNGDSAAAATLQILVLQDSTP